MTQELLTLQNLAKYYASAQSVVVGLNRTNLTFCRGEFVAITGESGSGKSTLAHVLGGILPYESGELLFKDKPTSHYDSADWERYRRDCVSFISQSYGILPGSSVQDNMTCALRLTGMDKAEAQRRAEEILKKVELWDLRRRRAAKLSSGQKQRLSIARALAKPAPVLIADEPTGNLDAENSAMVIELLAQAAQDRLVILITHEFSEAADYVTRHIELHDGRVAMDVRLREVPELPAPAPKTVKTEGKKGLSWFVARFQMKARPVWSALMLGLFAATVFAMYAISGTSMSPPAATFTSTDDHSAFRNGESCRIVVARSDRAELTGEDIDKLLAVKYVDSVEEYGYVSDVQYAYREGVDYELKNGVETVGSGLGAAYVATETYSLRKYQNNMPFVRTVPTMPEGEEFISAGRMPENLYEVVAAGGEDLLGRKLTVLVQDQKNWGVDSFIRMEVTVVGVTDRGYHLYFHEDLGKMMLANARSKAEVFYMPMPNEPNIVGPLATSNITDGRGNVTFIYKYREGDVIGKDGRVARQIKKQIAQTIVYMDKFVTGFSLDGWDDVGKYIVLRDLVYNAEIWLGIEGQLRAVMEELNLDSDYLSAIGDWQVQDTVIREVLSQPENMDRLRNAAESLFEKFKEAYEKKKADYFEMDLSQLTLEESLAVLEEWGGFLEIQTIQPGEIVVSPSMISVIANELSKGSEIIGTGGKVWDQAWDQAAFLKYDFPVMGLLEVPDAAQKEQCRRMTVVGATDVGYHRAVLLHPKDFEEMSYHGKGDQVSVYAEDYAYVDRILADIHALGYGALSPYQEGAVTQKEELAAQRTQTLRVCIIALLAVIALQILLLRSMFSMETESYRLLSHIGLNGVTAKRSVLWQILTFALGGQLLGVGLIGVCAAGGVDQLVHILRYLPLPYRLGLCLLHLAASLFTAVWAMKALEKQVFPQSGSEPDLDWDVLDEEVEA